MVDQKVAARGTVTVGMSDLRLVVAMVDQWAVRKVVLKVDSTADS